MLENPNAKFQELSDKYAKRTITAEELDRECAYWFLDCFDEIYLKPNPAMPMALVEYNNQTEDKKRKFGPDFWLMTEVRNYLDEKLAVKNWNHAKLYQLELFIELIPKEDIVSRSKYEQKIYDFRERLFPPRSQFKSYMDKSER